MSLRGLSTNSTLVLFDGMSAAYYPLADDGTRNFVDLNTIPDEIVDRIEVLRDGASSSYGADAIAGVVNIITKREDQGIGGRVEAGISERGDAANQRLSIIAGTGDIEEDGYNAYVSGFYIHNDALYNRDRPIRKIRPTSAASASKAHAGPTTWSMAWTAMANIILGRHHEHRQFAYVRPFDATNTNALGRYQLLNPALGCPRGPSYNLTANDLGLTMRMAI